MGITLSRALEIYLTPGLQCVARWRRFTSSEELGQMHRTAPLFDASRSALMLRVGRESGLRPPNSPTLPPNTMRANDLSRGAAPGSDVSTIATYGADRERSLWKP